MKGLTCAYVLLSAVLQIVHAGIPGLPVYSPQRVFELLQTGIPVLWSGNGHYYELVEALEDFKSALDKSTEVFHEGRQGHLVTITSTDENNFVRNSVCVSEICWIAASDSELEGTWKWVAGPETGQAISQGYWDRNQPTNSSAEIDCAFTEDGTWYDSHASFKRLYVIEYECPVQPATSGACARTFCMNGF